MSSGFALQSYTVGQKGLQSEPWSSCWLPVCSVVVHGLPTDSTTSPGSAAPPIDSGVDPAGTAASVFRGRGPNGGYE